MKKKYSRKFICEAIAYWKKQLRQLNEKTSFFAKYDHTDPAIGDQYPPYDPSMTWSEFKAAGDKALKDNDIFNIALLCGPNDIGFGEEVCYVDVDVDAKRNVKTLVVSCAGG